jgi:hypothetical protein
MSAISVNLDIDFARKGPSFHAVEMRNSRVLKAGLKLLAEPVSDRIDAMA